jgi:hypothetical protein
LANAVAQTVASAAALGGVVYDGDATLTVKATASGDPVAIMAAIGTLNANVTLVVVGEKVGERWVVTANTTNTWGDQAAATDNWTDEADASSSWSDLAANSNNWTQVADGSSTWLKQ